MYGYFATVFIVKLDCDSLNQVVGEQGNFFIDFDHYIKHKVLNKLDRQN